MGRQKRVPAMALQHRRGTSPVTKGQRGHGRGAWWDGGHPQLLAWEGGRRCREKVVGGTQDIWYTSRGRDWNAGPRENMGHGVGKRSTGSSVRQGVGGLGGRTERKGKEKSWGSLRIGDGRSLKESSCLS